MIDLNTLLNPCLLCGVVFFIVGAILFYFPPKEINLIYGYRTNRSMKNQESWDFAQKFSSKKMIISGVLLTLIGLIISIISLDNQLQLYVSLLLIGLSLFWMIFTTENQLKKRF